MRGNTLSRAVLPRLSDAQLSAQLACCNPAALEAIYDRYATFVYTVLCDAAPNAADALLEQVFALLWQRGDAPAGPSLARRLLALSAEVVVQHRAAETPGDSAAWGRPLLPALAPFSALSSELFEVLTLVYLGKLSVRELAVALERDTASIHQTLAADFPTLRSRPATDGLERLAAR